MTTVMQIFYNDEFGDVRVVEINGEPWFVGKDVAVILGYSNPQKALRDHVSDKYKRTERIVHPQGGAQDTILISEAGLYRLVMRSNLPKAENFSDWVCSEVLPTIRKKSNFSVTPVANAFRDARAIADEIQVEFIGVRRDMAISKAIDMAEKKHDVPLQELKKLLSYAEHDMESLSPTEIGKRLGGVPPDFINKIFADAGLQYKQGNHWRLTTDGMDYSKEIPYGRIPYTRNHYSGYQIRWNRSVIKLIRDWM